MERVLPGCFGIATETNRSDKTVGVKKTECDRYIVVSSVLLDKIRGFPNRSQRLQKFNGVKDQFQARDSFM